MGHVLAVYKEGPLMTNQEYQKKELEYQKNIISHLGSISTEISSLTKVVSSLEIFIHKIENIVNLQAVEHKDIKRLINKLFDENDKLKNRLHSLEIKLVEDAANQKINTSEATNTNKVNIEWIKHGVWLVIGGVITLGFAYIKGLFKSGPGP